jgi:hypothetical protein
MDITRRTDPGRSGPVVQRVERERQPGCMAALHPDGQVVAKFVGSSWPTCYPGMVPAAGPAIVFYPNAEPKPIHQVLLGLSARKTRASSAEKDTGSLASPRAKG